MKIIRASRLWRNQRTPRSSNFPCIQLRGVHEWTWRVVCLEWFCHTPGGKYDINDAIHHQEVDIDEFGRFLVSSYEKHASVTCHDFIPAKRHRNAPGQLHTCFSGQGIFIWVLIELQVRNLENSHFYKHECIVFACQSVRCHCFQRDFALIQTFLL